MLINADAEVISPPSQAAPSVRAIIDSSDTNAREQTPVPEIMSITEPTNTPVPQSSAYPHPPVVKSLSSPEVAEPRHSKPSVPVIIMPDDPHAQAHRDSEIHEHVSFQDVRVVDLVGADTLQTFVHYCFAQRFAQSVLSSASYIMRDTGSR
jgi:hypothetical protein